MSENNEVKATEIAETSGYAALANMDTVNSALAEDCDGLEFSLDKIKIPSGGGINQHEGACKIGIYMCDMLKVLLLGIIKILKKRSCSNNTQRKVCNTESHNRQYLKMFKYCILTSLFIIDMGRLGIYHNLNPVS